MVLVPSMVTAPEASISSVDVSTSKGTSAVVPRDMLVAESIVNAPAPSMSTVLVPSISIVVPSMSTPAAAWIPIPSSDVTRSSLDISLMFLPSSSNAILDPVPDVDLSQSAPVPTPNASRLLVISDSI